LVRCLRSQRPQVRILPGAPTFAHAWQPERELRLAGRQRRLSTVAREASGGGPLRQATVCKSFLSTPAFPWQKLQPWRPRVLKSATSAGFEAGNAVARRVCVAGDQRIVYILKNGDSPPRYYTGLTSNLETRLMFHNNGLCSHTAVGRSWHVDVLLEFADEHRAAEFEKYLKSGSGVAFSNRHLRSSTT